MTSLLRAATAISRLNQQAATIQKMLKVVRPLADVVAMAQNAATLRDQLKPKR